MAAALGMGLRRACLAGHHNRVEAELRLLARGVGDLGGDHVGHGLPDEGQIAPGLTGRSGTSAPDGWTTPPIEWIRRGIIAFLPFAIRATMVHDCSGLMLVKPCPMPMDGVSPGNHLWFAGSFLKRRAFSRPVSGTTPRPLILRNLDVEDLAQLQVPRDWLRSCRALRE